MISLGFNNWKLIRPLEEKHHIQNIYFQEPTFNSLDKAFLQSRSFKIIDSPECIQHMTEKTFLFTPCCDKDIVTACLYETFPAMLLGRMITDQSRWFLSPEKAPGWVSLQTTSNSFPLIGIICVPSPNSWLTYYW